MKFGQLIEQPVFYLLKSFILAKSKWSAARFHYVSIALKLAYNWNKLFKTLKLYAQIWFFR